MRNKWVSVLDLAGRIALSRQSLSRACKLGKIKAVKVGRQYWITLREAAKWKKGTAKSVTRLKKVL